MKKPHEISGPWNCTMNKEPVLVTAPGTKKFKRKSREPKRLFIISEDAGSKDFPVDMSNGHTAEDSIVSPLVPHQGQLVMSQGMMTNRKAHSETPEDNMTLGHGSAIDMRIGLNVTAMSSKMSQSTASSLSLHEISHWPSSMSQSLSKLGIHSSLHLPTPPSGPHSPGGHEFLLEPSLLGQPVPRSYQSSQSLDHMDTHQSSQSLDHMDSQDSSPKDSPRKRVGIGPHARGHIPEVKAIQQTRRLLANARERTRVHTISAAFEALRKQVPCYSYGQKLSKLAILRIACNYILSLAQLAELDYSSDRSIVSFSQCVEQCTRTLQAEGRSKKRKE
ncbi:transcription factor atoh8 [Nothobranchius furzeri]|uniref:Protein atonal homolog 8 n=1 Tax=Nothobranchius furzeri TaxID=105023 RepID=A0A8C6M6E5_NOTFU|nr:transcription factor atoh8 [Nothobranchius furzeri]KAF7227902.1 transcript variant X1 [Nothobranchius furzeri]